MAEKKINENFDNMPKLGRMGGGGPQRFAPGPKPKNTKGTLLRLIKIYFKWRKSILLAVVLTILSALVSLFTPFLL